MCYRVRESHRTLTSPVASALKPCAPLLLSAFLALGSAHAHEAASAGHEELDTEHIFGFTEGADIGEKGEKELEGTTDFRFGRPGSYTAIESETAYRYVFADRLRASLSGLVDYHNIAGVPGLADKNAFDFSGIASEWRWHPIERSATSPVGATLSLTPSWRRIDDQSGAPSEIYAASTEILVDAAPVRDKLFTAFNLDYEPSIARAGGGWTHNDFLEASLAMAYAVTPDVLFGAEIRHLSTGENGPFAAHGLFVGPSIYYKLSKDFAIKAAWSEQIPDETTHRLDLVNFERHQARLVLVKGF